MVSGSRPAPPRPAPRLILVTPPLRRADDIAPALAEAMTAGGDAIATVILRLADEAEREQINLVKALAKTVQSRDAAVLLDGRAGLVTRSGADGAHLAGIDAFQEHVGALKPDRIAGAGNLASRHDAMLAAEAGADYVMFGEPGDDGHRPPFDAIVERVAWWAEVFEAPCVAYAGEAGEIAPLIAAGADFAALDPTIWTAAPRAAIAAAVKALALSAVSPETVA